jgi:hypothetical protein
MKKQWKHYTQEEKVAVLRQHSASTRVKAEVGAAPTVLDNYPFLRPCVEIKEFKCLRGLHGSNSGQVFLRRCRKRDAVHKCASGNYCPQIGL